MNNNRNKNTYHYKGNKEDKGKVEGHDDKIDEEVEEGEDDEE